MNLWNRRNLFGLFYIAAVVFLCAVPSLCQAQEEKTALGELRIEGEQIAKLVLAHSDGHKETIDLPSETIRLPVGEYRLQQIYLKNDYTSGVSTRTNFKDWIHISEDKPANLKVGAPLNQVIKVGRHGPILMMDYKLLGVGGEIYISDRRVRPDFTIYNGEKKIGSGKFEYG